MVDYFYTSKLVYAAGAIEQGFEGVQTYDKNCVTGKMQWSDVLDLNTEYEQWRFPKTPHNVALMEVQQGDLIIDAFCEDHIRHAKGAIIYRNNKPFPVWDKEGV